MVQPDKIIDFTQLEVWKKCCDFKITISHFAKSLPTEEKYRLYDQIIRSSRSITNNIAEGYVRYHFQENIQFCKQARGSLYETLNHLICAMDEKYLTISEFKKMKNEFNISVKLLNGYISYLKKAKAST